MEEVGTNYGIVIKGTEIVQNQQEFLVSSFDISTLLTFTKYTSRLIIGYDENNHPIYNPEIQRKVENSRVEKIADFLINDPEATFPTNLVLHIPSVIIDRILRENEIVTLYLDKEVEEGVKENNGDIHISIIDGQHRIRGIEVAIERLKKDIAVNESALIRNIDYRASKKRLDYYKNRLGDLQKIKLVVTFFIDKTLEYQAMIFSTINRTQKRVSPSLVYSLFGLTSKDSPQKSSLEIVLALNGNIVSPFYNRIKLYGGDNKSSQMPLTQATMVRTILNLICENLRESENDRFKERIDLKKRNLSSQRYLPFREYYVRDEDTNISDILFYYFKAVSTVFKQDGMSLWEIKEDSKRLDNVLQTTVGYVGLLKMLVDLLPQIKEEMRYSVDTYKIFLEKASSLDFSDTERYPFTSKSQNILYLDLSLKIFPAKTTDDIRIVKLEEVLRR